MQRRTFLKAGSLASAACLLSSRRVFAQSADAHIEVLLEEPIDTISPLIYGHFIEELGAVVYDGVWVGENSKIKNTNGIRTALLDRLRAIKAPVIRWPGGCFADSYDWRDGVGPKDKRPRRTDFWVDDPDTKALPNSAPQKFDPNQFGTDDFMRLCRLSGAEPYLAANLRSLPAYVFDQWVEYCNAPAGASTWANVRAQGGTSEPYNVQFWGVGNESWGCGGNFSPEQYASEYRRFQSWVPAYGVPLKLVASGPNSDDVQWTEKFFANIFGERRIRPPFGWSLHYYTFLPQALRFADADVYPGYAKADRMEQIIRDHWAAMGVYDREHKTKLIVDEYGPWYRFSETRLDPTHVLGQQLTVRDAIMTALTLDIFNRNPEKVAMANCAQLINCIDSLFLSHEDNFIVTPVYHVFDLYKGHQGGQAVRTEFAAPALTFADDPKSTGSSEDGTSQKAAVQQGRLWGLNGSASVNGKNLTLTVTNPHLSEPRDAEIYLRGASAATAAAVVLGGGDTHQHNTFSDPDAVKTRTATAQVSGSMVRFSFPPSSVTKLEIALV